MNTTTIGNNIRIIREMKGYTQDYVATLLNMSQNNYSKIENGKNKINIELLYKLGELLETDPLHFMSSPEKYIQNNHNQSGGNGFVKKIVKTPHSYYKTQLQQLEALHQKQLQEVKDLYEARIKELKEVYEAQLKSYQLLIENYKSLS